MHNAANLPHQILYYMVFIRSNYQKQSTTFLKTFLARCRKNAEIFGSEMLKEMRGRRWMQISAIKLEIPLAIIISLHV